MTAAVVPEMPGAAFGRGLTAVRRRGEAVVVPLGALVAGLLAFALFLAVIDRPPIEFYVLVYQAAFGSKFAWENTLARTAPLLLAALCTALPARLGMIMIGGEGAIVLGGVAAGIFAMLYPTLPGVVGIGGMAAAAALVGGSWIGAVSLARHLRGVNETIASLLMAYVAIALMHHLVEGPFREAASLNKPSTAPLAEGFRVGTIPGLDVHWGLAAGIAACVLCWVLLERATWGFAARIVGGNVRAALVQGLPVGRLMVGFAVLGGALAGLAGMFEVAAVHGAANASLAAGYGYTGILIAFLARHHMLAILPVATLLAGFEAASGLVQRRMDLPDATVLVLQGLVFVALPAGAALPARLTWGRAPGRR